MQCLTLRAAALQSCDRQHCAGCFRCSLSCRLSRWILPRTLQPALTAAEGQTLSSTLPNSSISAGKSARQSISRTPRKAAMSCTSSAASSMSSVRIWICNTTARRWDSQEHMSACRDLNMPGQHSLPAGGAGLAGTAGTTASVQRCSTSAGQGKACSRRCTLALCGCRAQHQGCRVTSVKLAYELVLWASCRYAALK